MSGSDDAGRRGPLLVIHCQIQKKRQERGTGPDRRPKVKAGKPLAAKPTTKIMQIRENTIKTPQNNLKIIKNKNNSKIKPLKFGAKEKNH